MLFECSGIAIECQEHLTRFLTSASLVTAFIDTEKDHDLGNFRVGADNQPLLFAYLRNCDHRVRFLSLTL